MLLYCCKTLSRSSSKSPVEPSMLYRNWCGLHFYVSEYAIKFYWNNWIWKEQIIIDNVLLAPRKDDSDNYLYRNISVQLSMDKQCCAHQQWWMVKEECSDYLYSVLLSNVPLNDCKDIMMFLFNDKTFPESLSFISGFG